MTDMLRIGVMGAGVFGGYHASKCAAHPRADLVGVYDPDLTRARALAERYGGQAFSDIDAFLGAVQAVIIAVPAIHHGSCALQALRAECHVLVEKPITADIASAQEMITMARDKDLVLQIGHQERFVLQAIGLDRIASKPTRIETRRMSAYSERCTDVSVTLDLMTHDLDMVFWLLGESPKMISSDVQPVYGPHPDATLAYIQFKETLARLEASRAETGSVRTLHLTYPEGEVMIDFNAKTLTHNTPFDLNVDFGNHALAKDALGVADSAFIDAILDGKPSVITGEDGLAALRAAVIIDGEL